MQATDIDHFLSRHRVLVRLSEWLRRYDGLLPMADSLYVRSEIQAGGPRLQ